MLSIPLTTLEDFIDLRKERGLTPKQVSRHIHAEADHISKVERGELPYRHAYYMALLGFAVDVRELSEGP